MGTLQSPDLMREVVSRLHLDMDYKVPGRFHRQTVYGRQLPISISISDLPEDESATFTLQLSKGGKVTLFDIERNDENVGEMELKGNLGDTIPSGIGKIVVISTPLLYGRYGDLVICVTPAIRRSRLRLQC